MKGPIHFIWRVPHHDEHTYHHKERVFSNGTLTQCCDGIVSLALACALVNNPHQQVWLWSEQEWTDELVRSRLVNSPRLFFKHFDISKEAAGMDVIIDAFRPTPFAIDGCSPDFKAAPSFAEPQTQPKSACSTSMARANL